MLLLLCESEELFVSMMAMDFRCFARRHNGVLLLSTGLEWSPSSSLVCVAMLRESCKEGAVAVDMTDPADGIGTTA